MKIFVKFRFTHLVNILSCKHPHIRIHYLSCYSSNCTVQNEHKSIYVFGLHIRWCFSVHALGYSTMKTIPFPDREFNSFNGRKKNYSDTRFFRIRRTFCFVLFSSHLIYRYMLSDIKPALPSADKHNCLD